MFHSKAEPHGLGRFYSQNKLCAVLGGTLRTFQNDSEYEHMVNLKMGRNSSDIYENRPFSVCAQTCHAFKGE